jgi:exosortase O
MSRKAISVLPLILLLLWIWLYWPVFQYLAVLFTREEFRTNQVVLAIVAGLLIYKARSNHFHWRMLSTSPHLFIPGLVLAMGSSLAYLLVERYLDINTLSAFLFGLASYGLLGLWLAPERWKQGFPAMLLVVGVLPFGEHLDTFVGYPLRAFTASLVRNGLGALGFPSVGVDTILVFESGISQVDIPCSGVKSLWTGALFLLAATWIENKPINLRWMFVAAATGLLLFLANLLRVTLLAVAGPVLGWMVLARMIHVPLGVLGFLGTCILALFLLRRLPGWPAGNSPKERPKPGMIPRPVWLAPGMVMCVLIMALAYTPRLAGQAVSAAGPARWNFPVELSIQSSPLSTRELEWIRQGGAETADRYTFQWQDPGQGTTGSQSITGTVMLLTSRTWRGQHRPERCFEVFGLTIQESYTYLVNADFPLRFLKLSAPSRLDETSALYWLQSASQTTEDFGQRMWADLGPNREPWVLVTVLLDREVDPQMPEVSHLFVLLQSVVDRSLAEGGVP